MPGLTNNSFVILVCIAMVVFNYQPVRCDRDNQDKDVVRVSVGDPCNIECENDHKCFVHKFKDPLSGEYKFKGLCVPASHEALDNIDTDNEHVKLKVKCPAMEGIGGLGDIQDCGEYVSRECDDDLDCDTKKVCCSTTCWKRCLAPKLSRYPE